MLQITRNFYKQLCSSSSLLKITFWIDYLASGNSSTSYLATIFHSNEVYISTYHLHFIRSKTMHIYAQHQRFNHYWVINHSTGHDSIPLKRLL